mgnify:FL=1
MEKKKRNILIILSILLILITAFVIYLLIFKKEEKNYPKEPISQETIYPSSEKIEFKETFSETDKLIYALSKKTQLENVKKMIESLNLDIKIKDSKEAEYYNWSGNGWSFIYDLSSNYLIFNIEKGLEVGEVELNKNSFSNFVSKYFSKNWKYTVFETEKRPGGEVVSYAKRKISTDDVVESKIFNKYTDYLDRKSVV